MKKTLFIVPIMTIACFGFFVSTEDKNSEDSRTLLENVEALSQEEPDNCTDVNVNGYRQWKTEGNWLQSEKMFYDCCSVPRRGYSPKGSCMNM